MKHFIGTAAWIMAFLSGVYVHEWWHWFLMIPSAIMIGAAFGLALRYMETN